MHQILVKKIYLLLGESLPYYFQIKTAIKETIDRPFSSATVILTTFPWMKFVRSVMATQIQVVLAEPFERRYEAELELKFWRRVRRILYVLWGICFYFAYTSLNSPLETALLAAGAILLLSAPTGLACMRIGAAKEVVREVARLREQYFKDLEKKD
ncbi:MAG: hypothetical protein WCK46_00925 [Candidatus Adlerbacteria bacterium]